MDFSLFFQTLTASLSGIAAWFIYEHIKDFKTFKKEAGKDIQGLQKEREHFEFVVRSAGITLTDRVHDIERLHNQFSVGMKGQLVEVTHEVQKIKDMIHAIDGKIADQESHLKKIRILLRVD